MLEDELVAMVAMLPELPRDRLRVLAGEARALADGADAPARALAHALAAVLERYAEGAAPLEGWGLVAQAASTLQRALADPAAIAPTGLAAAAYELDTLAPKLEPTPAAPAAPDVPVANLRRRT